MERTSGTKKGLRLVATTIFLMAALASTGCDSIMGPKSSTDTAQNNGVVASNSGHAMNPSGHGMNP